MKALKLLGILILSLGIISVSNAQTQASDQDHEPVHPPVPQHPIETM